MGCSSNWGLLLLAQAIKSMLEQALQIFNSTQSFLRIPLHANQNFVPKSPPFFFIIIIIIDGTPNMYIIHQKKVHFLRKQGDALFFTFSYINFFYLKKIHSSSIKKSSLKKIFFSNSIYISHSPRVQLISKLTKLLTFHEVSKIQ